MTFQDLQLIEPLLRAVTAEGYTTPTPIQQQAIPHVLAGRDLVGLAQTGTGKTAAFALPLLQRLANEPRPHGGVRPTRVLILTPTRELASQIGESFGTYGRYLGFKHVVIFGGVGQQAQRDALRSGVDIVIATPGRFLDLRGQGFVHLDKLEAFILDEADRMLDMGFIHDVRKVIQLLPQKRQTLLFSATMPPDIQDLADRILRDPAKVAVVPPATTAERIEQSVYFVERGQKRQLLEWLMKNDGTITRALVFTRTKHGANKVADQLDRAHVRAEAIHGNKSQNARERALAHFKDGTTPVLVATDIAARGIDIDEISHVINYDLPNVPEQYVHRIGRTARAGASGRAISFCELDEREYLEDIEKITRLHVPRVLEHPFVSPHAPPGPTNLDPRAPRPPPRPAKRSNDDDDDRPPRQPQKRHEHARPHTPKPVQGAPKPTHGAPKPAHGTPKPAHGTPRPTSGAPKPAQGGQRRPQGGRPPSGGGGGGGGGRGRGGSR